MNSPVAEPPAADLETRASNPRRRVRFELIFASIWLAVGLFVVPATIFAVGNAVLGPYGENARLGRFYGDFLGDLAEPSVRAWAIALAPLALITLLRLTFVGVARGSAAPEPPPDEQRRAVEDARRIEPRVSVD
jgi:hypothetical protein